MKKSLPADIVVLGGILMGKVIKYRNIRLDYSKKENGMDTKTCRNFVMSMKEKDNEIIDMPARAQEVLEYFKIKDFDGGVPIVDILRKFGFKIFQSDLRPEGLSAYIAVDPKFEDVFGSNKITCVHVADNVGHKRFALAHELAHYLFDFNEDKNLYFYDTYFPQNEEDIFIEQRANQFAANLLMPENKFREKLEEYKKDKGKADTVNALGNYFAVSPTAILYRFRELKIDGYEN